MAKKIALVGIVFVIAAGVMFMMMRRSRMMNAGSYSSGGLVAVTADGTAIPVPPALAAASKLPENTALQEAGGLLIALGISPYPPSGTQATSFEVSLSDANGQAVSDATISLDLTMPAMPMPPNQLEMTAGQAGKYQASGYFTMRGLWRIEVIITRGGQNQSVFYYVGL